MREAMRRLGRRLAGDPGVLPDFVILGAQRAGTTFLWEELARHQDVRPSAVKEVRFFDRAWERGERWYRARFPRGPERPGDRSWRTGEATPYYLFHPLVPERAAAVLGDRALLIVVLRHPVDRAWSHYRMAVQRGYETAGFEEGLAREREHFAHWHALVAKGGHSLAHRRLAYLHRGLYAGQLERWREHMPADRLVILRADDLFDDTPRVYRELLARLGLADDSAGRAFQPSNVAPPAPLEPAVRAELQAFYSEELERLAAVYGVRWD